MQISKLIILLLLCIILLGCTQRKVIILKPVSMNADEKITSEINKSPAPKEVLLEQKELLSEPDEICIHSYETRPDGAMRITKIPSSQNGAFSPDGRKVVFTQFKSGYNEGRSDLKILDLETGGIETLLSDGNSNVNLPGSSWVGERIVFSSTKEPHDEIYAVDTDSGRVSQITSRRDLVAYEPSFSPDGRKIVFETHELDVEEDGVITIYDTLKQRYTTLTKKGDCRQPNWSPDGNLILYQRLETRWDIWIHDLTSGETFRLTSGGGDKTDASFSPDGKWIIYSSDEGDEEFANIYIMSVDGKDKKKITDFDGYDGAPSWSYDGKYIIFESTDEDPDDSRGTELWIISVEDIV